MTQQPLLAVEAVTKTYDNSEPVLAGVDVTIEAGQTVAVVGASGCGKSTLLHVIAGLLQPSSGRVVVDGIDIAGLGVAERARYRSRDLGIVFQFHHLLPQCSALENVLLPALSTGRASDPGTVERARELLASVGLADRTNSRPAELSGGECQRVAVARALINRPRLVLADEPTGSLDGNSADRVEELLRHLVEEESSAMLVVTHSEDLASRMQQTVRMQAGRLHPVEAAPS